MPKAKTKKLIYCAAALALAFVTSLIKVYTLPFGGSVTLFSMLFVVLIANWYGTLTGVLVGAIYGVLSFMQEPIFLSVPQFILDYICSFAALGLAGIFSNKKNGLLKGYIFGIFMRGAFATIAGYIFWSAYMPETFPKALEKLYSVIYNYGYILAEGIATIIVISVPAVANAIKMVKKSALE